MSGPRDVVVAIGSQRVGLVFALPWLMGLFGLTLGPVAASLAVSLTRWDGLSLSEGFAWVGIEHYRCLLAFEQGRPRDPHFYQAIRNSLVLHPNRRARGVGHLTGAGLVA